MDLPPNLYRNTDSRTGRVTYRYRDPRTGKFHGMGSDKKTAIEDAKALNAAIGNEIRERRLASLARSKVGGPTVAEYVRRYWQIVYKERGIKPNTERTRNYILDKMIAEIGPKLIKEVTVDDCAEILNGYLDRDKKRMAQSVRTVLIDFFRVARSEIEMQQNPAELTRAVNAKVQRSRLTLDEFQAIYGATSGLDPWVANAMMLALLTGQRREDLAGMRFKDARDGFLHVEQAKTGVLIRISTSLKLEAIGASVQDVIEQCRDIVVSPYMIHHTRARTHSKRGDPVHKDTISRGFARARALSGIEWSHPPTFHEIRSLAGRLYRQQGTDVQGLLGHRTDKMTDLYLNPRGKEWITVK